MLETLRSVLSLLLSYGLLLLANGLFGTLIGLRTKMDRNLAQLSGGYRRR